MKNLTVLIADDHPVFRQGTINVLKSTSFPCSFLEANNGLEVLAHLKNWEVDLLFLDIEMPEMNGLEAIKEIRKFSEIPVIAMSMHDHSSYIRTMYEHKANAYILKNTGVKELQRCISLILEGGTYYTPEVAYKLYELLNEPQNEEEAIELTSREKEVLLCICEQLTGKEAAQKLNLSEETIKTHRTSLLNKSQSKNTAGLVLFAIRSSYYKYK